MDNIKEMITEFLVFQGYSLTEYSNSVFFGDYFQVYSKNNVCIRLVSDKSKEAIDIGNLSDENQWYDLALVKALIINEKNLNHVTTIKEYKDFLETNIYTIEELFNNGNYGSTKEKLEALGNKRVSQILFDKKNDSSEN